VTTKVWYDQIRDGDLQRSAEASLQKLKMDDVDLLLIHWPNSRIPLAESIGALCDARRRGLARHIGVSNFPSALFAEAVSLSDEPLCVNQVEYHPYLNQDAVLATCRKHGMAMTSYAPIARAGALLNEAVIREIAREKGRKEAQIVLRWHIQQNQVVAIPKSSDPARISANIDLGDFELDDDEMARISALSKRDGRTIDPEWGPEWDAAV
jgi:diketogulonate reductase-like aldo/keto reductase